MTRRAGVHLFGALSANGTAAAMVAPTQVLSHRFPSRDCEDLDESAERLWLISSSVQEVLREALNAAVGPLSIDAIVADPSVSRRSLHRLRVSANGADLSEVYDIDIGQPLEFYANSFQVEIVVPPDAVEVPEAGSDATAQGTVYDSLVFVKGLAIEHSEGATTALLTDTVPVAAGDNAIVAVPSHARRVTATMTAAGAYPPVTRWFRGDPTIGIPGAIELGALPWETTGQRRSVSADVPSASHLLIDADLLSGQDRLLTFVWEVRP